MAPRRSATSSSASSQVMLADAAEWMRQALRVVRALDVAIHFRAEKSASEWVIRIAGDTNGSPVANRDEHRTGVGAIVRTRAAHDRVAGALIYWTGGGERCFHCNRI